MRSIIPILFLITISFGTGFSQTKTIPSFEKLAKEGLWNIELGTIFNACIDKLGFKEKDLLTGEKKLDTIFIKGTEYNGTYTSAVLYVSDWRGLSSKDKIIPAADDCYNFQVELMTMSKDNLLNEPLYTGFVKVVEGEFDIDDNAIPPQYKEKLTVSDYMTNRLDYGSRIIEITGKIYEIDYLSNTWFQINLYSDKITVNSKDDLIRGYYFSEHWKNDELIITKLRSLQVGQTLTLKGQFKGPNTVMQWQFEVLEIID